MARRDLTGHVAIVTGASSGVGWQTAIRLAEEGLRLCVTARRRAALEQLAREVEARGGECIVAPADVTKMDEVERVVARCLDHYGRIDVLVNDAAVQVYAPFVDLPFADVERVFDVTCFGYMRFAKAVLPHFLERDSGHLVNVLSMLSRGAAPLLSSYTAAKHALLGWQKCLELELWKTNVKVSGVLVPSVATPMFDHAPTLLGKKPVPVPPTYDPDVAARAVVACLRHPRSQRVPVFLQGKLILALDAIAPWVGNTLLGLFGERMQTTGEPLDRPRGNLFAPVPEGVGPRGSVPPTPRWIRAAATVAIVGAAGGAVAGAVQMGRRLARRAG